MKDYLYDIIEMEKYPTTNDNYVGVEIECYGELSREKLEDKFIEAGLAYNVTVMDDCSVEPPRDVLGIENVRRYNPYTGNYDIYHENRYYESYEVKLLTTEKELRKNLRKACKILKEAKCKVNHTCGLHVHLDMRNRNFKKCFANLFKAQNLMFKVQPKKRRLNTFCKKLNTAKEYNKGKYSAINGRTNDSLGTIEVRVHEATIDYSSIFNWIEFLLQTIKADKLGRTIGPKTVERIYKKKTQQYLSKRMKRYA